MKTFTTALNAHYESGSTTLAVCLEVARADGLVYRFTSHDRDLLIGGHSYTAGPGLELSDLATSSGLAPDNLELRILYADDAITRDDLLAGRWDNASYRLFEVDYTQPDAGSNVLSAGTTGEVRIAREDGFTIELRSIKQALQKPVGIVTQKTCRNRLGDNRCGVGLGPFTFTGVAVTSVTSQRVFASSGLSSGSPTHPADYFTEGLVTFTTGGNAGTSRKIKAYTVGGQIECLAPFTFAVEVGDEFTVVAGCRKRLADCRDKFDNVLNFNGEPHLPGTDALTALPDAGA